MKWFGSSGVRGVAFGEFSLELCHRIGISTGLGYDDVVLGRDARVTGEMFSSAFSSTLMSVGADVSDVGIVTTPTLAHAAKKRKCGVMITASHNPPEYNGVKLWNPDGSSFNTAQMEEIESLMEKEAKYADWSSVGRYSQYENATADHMERILGIVGSSHLTVVVDCANGPASLITPYLLEEMGCRVITLNAQLDGRFPGRPGEPSEDNLRVLMEIVVKLGADLGIAHDGDADRMVAIDDRGRYAGGDTLLKIIPRELGAKRIVVPVDATMLLDDWFDEVIRTKVGDSFVSDKIKESGADFGGEPSGTSIFPDLSYCPDGILAAARLAEICSERKLSVIVDETPSLPLLKEVIPFKSSDRESILSNLQERIDVLDEEQIDMTDGIKLRYEDGWSLIRLSGTEPKMRIVAEARTQERAKEIMTETSEIARGCLT